MAFPYYSSYQPHVYPTQYQQQNNGLIWVQGIEAAKSYPVSAGQSILLMDSESNRFFIKSADASGMPLPLRVFDYTEREIAQNASGMRSEGRSESTAYITRAELEERLEHFSANLKRGEDDAE